MWVAPRARMWRWLADSPAGRASSSSHGTNERALQPGHDYFAAFGFHAAIIRVSTVVDAVSARDPAGVS